MRFPAVLRKAGARLRRIFRFPFGRRPAAVPPDGGTAATDEIVADEGLPAGIVLTEGTEDAAAEGPGQTDTHAAVDAEGRKKTPGASQSMAEVPGTRDYMAIGRVGVLKAVQPPRMPASPATSTAPMSDPPAPVQAGKLLPRAQVPASVLNMHRLNLVAPVQRPAAVKVSEYPGPEVDNTIDVTDDLYGYVARTINLKLRVSAARQEG